MCGVEFEWFNFAESPQSWAAKRGVGPETITPGMFGYSLLRMADQRGFFNALMDDMGAFGVPIEGLHTETGPGVYEAAITFGDGWRVDLGGLVVEALHLGHGHTAGDEVLRWFAQTGAGLVRQKIDVIGRFGGEEFAIIYPETDLPSALSAAERLRVGILGSRVRYGELEIPITFKPPTNAKAAKPATALPAPMPSKRNWPPRAWT